jgi:hypothetical protein
MTIHQMFTYIFLFLLQKKEEETEDGKGIKVENNKVDNCFGVGHLGRHDR